MSNFSDRIKALRDIKGVTQKQVANDTGLSESTYQSYELARKEPSLNSAKKLAEYFNVSIDYLACRTDNPEMVI